MTMEHVSHEDLLAVCAIAEQAGRAILEIYGHDDLEVRYKADHSPVTAADLAANRVIADGLAALTPDIPVLTEESDAADWTTRRTWQRYWLVDPLDGTREFVKRNGEFTVNIALIEGHETVMGVVQVPVTGDIYFARRGKGAFLRSGNNTRAITARPFGDELVVASSRFHAGGRQAGLLDRLGPYRRMIMGSSLKFCMLARGDADIYLRTGETSEWDTAAAQCVLEEAGGAVLDLDGNPLRYNTHESLINPEFLAVADPSIDWTIRLAANGPLR